MKRGLVLIAAVPLAAALGCREAPHSEAAEAVSVGTATVRRTDLADLLMLRGRLVSSPREDVTLAPQVAGRLTGVAVREGDTVAEGALLASVDHQQLDDAEAAATAALAKAREDEEVRSKALALTSRLLEKGIVSREERDNDRAALETARAARIDAEARVRHATRQRGWSELRAPFTGVVAQVLRHAGEIVDGTGSTPVLRLLGTSVQEVSADASTNDLSRIAIGSEVTVRPSGGDAAFPGQVVRVARAVDPATGVGEVRARLSRKSAAPLLSPVAIAIVVAAHRDVIAVPVEALRRSETGVEEVVLVEKEKARVRGVRSGVVTDRLIEITEGLAGGETVVVDSPLGLADGVPLRVRTKPSP